MDSFPELNHRFPRCHREDHGLRWFNWYLLLNWEIWGVLCRPDDRRFPSETDCLLVEEFIVWNDDLLDVKSIFTRERIWDVKGESPLVSWTCTNTCLSSCLDTSVPPRVSLRGSFRSNLTEVSTFKEVSCSLGIPSHKSSVGLTVITLTCREWPVVTSWSTRSTRVFLRVYFVSFPSIVNMTKIDTKGPRGTGTTIDLPFCGGVTIT